MKKAYVILSPGRAGDFGGCLLLNEHLGEYLAGEIELEDVSDDLLKELQTLMEDDELAQDFLLLRANGEDLEQAYYSLINLTYEKKSDLIIEFNDIADFANYVRDNTILVEYIDY